MKRLIALLVLLALCLSCSLAEEAQIKGFDSPLLAVERFIECVGALDFDGALDTFYAEASAGVYDMGAVMERIGMYDTFTFSMPLPSEYEAYQPLNAILTRAVHARQLVGYLSSVLLGETFVNGEPRYRTKNGLWEVVPGEELTTEDFLAAFDPAPLRGITARSVYLYDDEMIQSEANQNNVRRQGIVYGFTQQANLLIAYQLADGRVLWGSAVAVKMPEGWFLSGLNSPLLNGTAYGSLSEELKDVPMPTEENGFVLLK